MREIHAVLAHFSLQRSETAHIIRQLGSPNGLEPMDYIQVNEPTRVLLADDHPGVRSMVRADLEETGFVVCAEASDAAGAVEAAERERPDLCLLDVRMPGSGLVAAWDITSRLPGTKVVMLTVSRSEEHELAALRAGAVGYVIKDVDGPRLAAALRALAAGEVNISARTASRLLELGRNRGSNGRRGGRRRSRDATTGVEDQVTHVLQLVSGGRSVSEAAAELGIQAAVALGELLDALERVRIDRAALASLET